MASVALSFPYVAFVRILELLRLRRDGRDELGIEVIVVRHEVSVLRRQRVRSALEPANRAPLAGLSRLLSKSRRERFFVRPETLLRWHRDLVRRRWTYKRSRMGPPGVGSGTVPRLPASVWQMRPSSVVWRRVHAAMLRASRTRVVVIERAAFQPTRRRENTSMTKAT